MKKLKRLVGNITRVLRVASKPTSTEYWSSFKITGLGLIVIGLVGFTVFLVFRLTGLFA